MEQDYSELRERLDTGDIVLFSGKGGISTGIKWFTHSNWSHVGMVLRLPEWDVVLLWESTTLSNIADIESGKERQGVQLVPLSERVRKYDGDVCIRLLHVQRTKEMLDQLAELRSEVKGRPYEKDKIELIKSAWDDPLGLGANREDLSSLFCSELVAEAYQRMGLLPDSPPANEYTPKDFSEDEGLELLNGSLGEEIAIVPPGA